MNARLMKDEIVIIPQVNVGMAVALEDGLIVPVIRGRRPKIAARDRWDHA